MDTIKILFRKQRTIKFMAFIIGLSMVLGSVNLISANVSETNSFVDVIINKVNDTENNIVTIEVSANSINDNIEILEISSDEGLEGYGNLIINPYSKTQYYNVDRNGIYNFSVKFAVKDNAPSEDIVVDVPSEDIVVDVPSEDIVADAPSEDIVVDAPSEDIVADVPSEDIAVDAPSEDIVVDAPSEDIVADAPSEDIVADGPSEDIVADVPSEDIVADAPSEDIVAEVIKTSIVVSEIMSETLNINRATTVTVGTGGTYQTVEDAINNNISGDLEIVLLSNTADIGSLISGFFGMIEIPNTLDSVTISSDNATVRKIGNIPISIIGNSVPITIKNVEFNKLYAGGIYNIPELKIEKDINVNIIGSKLDSVIAYEYSSLSRNIDKNFEIVGDININISDNSQITNMAYTFGHTWGSIIHRGNTNYVIDSSSIRVLVGEIYRAPLSISGGEKARFESTGTIDISFTGTSSVSRFYGGVFSQGSGEGFENILGGIETLFGNINVNVGENVEVDVLVSIGHNYLGTPSSTLLAKSYAQQNGITNVKIDGKVFRIYGSYGVKINSNGNDYANTINLSSTARIEPIPSNSTSPRTIRGDDVYFGKNHNNGKTRLIIEPVITLNQFGGFDDIYTKEKITVLNGAFVGALNQKIHILDTNKWKQDDVVISVEGRINTSANPPVAIQPDVNHIIRGWAIQPPDLLSNMTQDTVTNLYTRTWYLSGPFPPDMNNDGIPDKDQIRFVYTAKNTAHLEIPNNVEYITLAQGETEAKALMKTIEVKTTDNLIESTSYKANGVLYDNKDKFLQASFKGKNVNGFDWKEVEVEIDSVKYSDVNNDGIKDKDQIRFFYESTDPSKLLVKGDYVYVLRTNKTRTLGAKPSMDGVIINTIPDYEEGVYTVDGITYANRQVFMDEFFTGVNMTGFEGKEVKVLISPNPVTDINGDGIADSYQYLLSVESQNENQGGVNGAINNKLYIVVPNSQNGKVLPNQLPSVSPSSSYRFDHWLVDGNKYYSNQELSDALQIPMDRTIIVTANFTRVSNSGGSGSGGMSPPTDNITDSDGVVQHEIIMTKVDVPLESPQTGDSNPYLIVIFLLISSGITLIFISTKKLKNK